MPPPINRTLPPVTNAVETYFLGLTNNGRDGVDEAGVQKLVEYVERHDIDGFEVRDQPTGQTEAEKAYLAGVLDKRDFRTFLTVPGRVAMEQRLGRYNAIYGGQPGAAVEMPTGSVTRIAIDRVPTASLADAFRQEVAQRADIFRNPLVSAEEKGKKLYLLFADYARSLNARFSGREQGTARRELLATLADLPASTALFLHTDSDGDGFINAYELALGTDPGRPQNQFPKRKEGWATYQNMHGSFYEVADKLDAYLKAAGRPAGISEHEHRSALAWLIGERAGNTSTGSFSESGALKSTGVDFAKALFPASSPAWSRKLDPNFDIAVDFIDGAGGFVSFDRGAGDRMAALHKTSGEVLRSKIEDVTIEGEEPPGYRPIFENAAGEVVPATDVKLVIQNRLGRTKGDGAVEGHHSAGWWGFCDRNALNTLVTTRYGYPAPDQEVALKVGDQEFKFSPREILDIVGRRMTELFSRYDYTGERFDDKPSRLELRDGTSVVGKLAGGEVETQREGIVREGDTVAITARGDEDAFGRLAVRVVKKTGEGEAGTQLIATDPKGATFELPVADLPGGFRANNVRATAWKPSAADVTRLSDLMMPVVESNRSVRSRYVPTKEEVAQVVNAAFDALAADANAEIGSKLYEGSKYEIASLINRWASKVGGAEVRAEKLFLPALADLKRAHASSAEPAERAAAIEEVVKGSRSAALLHQSLDNLGYQMHAELGHTDETWWQLSYSERPAKILEWFDAGDASKVAKIKAAIVEAGLPNSADAIFRSIERDRVLSKVEVVRKREDVEAANEHKKYVGDFKAKLGRINEVVIAHEELNGSTLIPRGFSMTVPPVEGSDEDWSTTLTVTDDRLIFEWVSYYGSYTHDAQLEALRSQVFDWAKGVATTGTVSKKEEEMTFPEAKSTPQRFEVALADGTKRSIRSDEIHTMVREEADDVRLDELIAHVARHDGVTNADSWMNEGVSNGLHVFDSVHQYSADDRDAPTWVTALKDEDLFGKEGPVKDKSKVKFFDLGQNHDGNWSSGTRGWVEFDAEGLPVNSAQIQGQFDFLWTVEGTPDWENGRPTFNPHVPSDLVLQLYTRSVKDPTKLQELADQKLLPSDWRKYLA